MKCPYCGYATTHDEMATEPINWHNDKGTFYLNHYPMQRPVVPTGADVIMECVHLVGCPACRKVFIGNTY